MPVQTADATETRLRGVRARPMRGLVFAAACLLLAAVPPSQGATIMAIDYGNRFIKVGMTQTLKRFHIVEDETSKRKSPGIVGFEDGQRRFGNEAKGLAIKKSQRTFEKFRNILGVGPDSQFLSSFAAEGYPHEFRASDDGRGMLSIDFEIGNPDINASSLSVEQLVAMQLEYIRKNSEADADEPVVDAVICIPGNWDMNRRRSMLDAAELAGINVVSLINENTAAAVQYGIDYDYKLNKTETLAIYNMGDSITQVSIVRYSAYKRRKSDKRPTGQLEVLATAYDDTLGGQMFDRLLVKRMADEFNEIAREKGNTDADIFAMPRAMAKLRKKANKAKEILSANTQIPIYMESLALNIDYKSHLTRAALYEDAEPLLDRASAPLVEAMQRAGVSASDLKTTLLIGGSVRIPGIQQALRTALGSDDALGFNLDGDESIALGAAFMAANISTAFKVRPIGLVEKIGSPIEISIFSPAVEASGSDSGDEDSNDADGDKTESVAAAPEYKKRSTLFTAESKYNKKKTVTFRHDRDFTVTVAYKATADDGRAAEDRTLEDRGIAQFNITGVARASAKHVTSDEKPDEKPKVTLSFKLTSSGLIELAKATVSVQSVQKIKPKKPKINDPVDDFFGDSNKTYARCEADTAKGDAEQPNRCSACTHYISGCDNVTQCEEMREQEANGNATSVDVYGGLMYFRLFDNCTYSATLNTCVNYNDKPCYRVVEAEAQEAQGGEGSQDNATKTDDASSTNATSTNATSTNATSTNTTTANATAEETEPKTRLVWTRKALRAKRSEYGTRVGMSAGQTRKQRAVLKKLSEADELQKAIARSKNALESYGYSARNLLREEVGEEITTEEEREGLLESLEAVEDWLYEQDPSEDTLAKFDDKLAETRALMAAVEFRASEYEERERVANIVEEVLGENEAKWVGKLKNRSWIPARDVEELETKITALREWLSDVQAKQAESPLTEAPVYNSSTVYSKLASVQNYAKRLLTRKKPKKPKGPMTFQRCESGKKKKKKSCSKCTHYAYNCANHTKCASNATRYELYGKSKCTFSSKDSACMYSVGADSKYPCYVGVPKKKKPTNKTATPTPSSGSTDSGESDAKGDDASDGSSESKDEEAAPEEDDDQDDDTGSGETDAAGVDADQEGADQEGAKGSEDDADDTGIRDEL